MEQNQDAIARKRAILEKDGIELSEDLNTIRITAGFLPDGWEDLTDEDMEVMTPEAVEQERKRLREYHWKSFIDRLISQLHFAGLHEAVYLSNPRYPDVEYRNFPDFAEAYEVLCDEEKSGWDRVMGVRLVSRVPREIIVDEDHPYLSVRDGVLFNKDQTELLWYPYGKEGETYTIPDGVTKIGCRAFAGYRYPVAQLKEDGSRVERLFRRVFNNVIDGGVNVEYVKEKISVSKYVFNRNLRHVIMPDTVTVIEENAFDHCIFLNSAELSSSLEEIGSNAFKGCKEMKEISLPDSLERLIAERRYPCSRGFGTDFFPDNLERIHFLGARCRLQPIITGKTQKMQTPSVIEPYTAEFFSLIIKNRKKVTITFEAGNGRFTSEGGVIFNKDKTELIYCPLWKSDVTVPKTVVRIGRKAFGGRIYEGGNRTLTRVVFAGSAVTDIGDRAFAGCASLQDIDLRGVKQIGDGAFAGCRALTHIGLRSVEYIGDGAFAGCRALTHIDLRSVEYIGDDAFLDCTALEPVVTVPESCRRMSRFAFSCSKINHLTTSIETLRVPRDTELFWPDRASAFRHRQVSIPEIEHY